MHSTFEYPTFEFKRPPEMGAVAEAPDTGAAGASHARHPLIIVGAGPVGMAAALDARRHGLPVIVLDDDHTVSVGSRGLCYAKRTLDILDRLDVGEAVVNKGVTWNVGRTFFGEREVFNFNLLPEPEHHRPGMVNLQQYYLEHFQVQACDRAGVDIRWQHKVVGVQPDATGATLDIETPEGPYRLRADWLVVCDGARSPIRRMMGLDMEGQVFKDRFLIADVVMKAPFPAERWFWFDPPFHRHQSVLLHREADDVWRIDFQLGWEADPEEEKKPEKVIPRIQAMLGPDVRFDLEWVSVYTFQCRRMARFDHGRVLFAGDAAHQVSPFGARGANSGIQDADNLMWKVAFVIKGWASSSLLESYNVERGEAADENILNSTRSTDFITPKSRTSRAFRDAALQLAQHHAFARKLVNSGRLSVPTHHAHSPLNTPLDHEVAGWMLPGAPMDDAPVVHEGQPGWLLRHLGGRFQLLLFVSEEMQARNGRVFEALNQMPALQAWKNAAATQVPEPDVDIQHLKPAQAPVQLVVLSETQMDAPAAARWRQAFGAIVLHDLKGLAAQRCDAQAGTALLLRPDQHICARWRNLEPEALQQALRRATGN